MEAYIDLHAHSTFSDGTCSPKELVNLAADIGLKAIALTDHDTINGIPEAMLQGEKKQIEVVAGIEFSTNFIGHEIHVLGYDIPYDNPSFIKQLDSFMDSRAHRDKEMVKKLQQHGIDISLNALKKAFPNAVITRANFARYMLDHGYISSISEAFDKYIGDSGPCFVEREKISPTQAVTLIIENGGIPVLAHPLLYHLSEDDLYKLTRQMKEAGLVGIEAIYSRNHKNDEAKMRHLAQHFGLKISGGSDFHGDNKPDIALGWGCLKENSQGNLKIPYRVLEELRKGMVQ